MLEIITWSILEVIHHHYNPLGEHHYFLVYEFLSWSIQRGSYYWIIDGAIELGGNLKDNIKEVPFGKEESTYRDLLRIEWLVFLNLPKYRENILREYYGIMSH